MEMHIAPHEQGLSKYDAQSVLYEHGLLMSVVGVYHSRDSRWVYYMPEGEKFKMEMSRSGRVLATVGTNPEWLAYRSV